MSWQCHVRGQLLHPRPHFLRVALLTLSLLVLCWTAFFRTKMHSQHRTTRVVMSEKVYKVNATASTSLHCQLPRLDPFHPDMMKFIKKVTRPQCKGRRLGKVEKGWLVIRANKVQSAVLYPIRRAKDNDFEIRTNTWLPLIDHPSSTIKEGATGCLQFKTSKSEFLLASTKKDELSLMMASCHHSGILRLHGDKEFWIEHVLTKKCINYVGSTFKLTTDCGASQLSKFKVKDKKLKVFGTIDSCVDVEDRKLVSRNCAQIKSSLQFFAVPTGEVHIRTQLLWDGVIVEIMQDGQLHKEYHLNAVKKPGTEPKTSASMQAQFLNVVMLMYDSQSAANFQRVMTKTMKRLKGLSTFLLFEGHTIVGDGTTAQLCAMLTGVPEEELPEARKAYKNAQPVDRWPFIFTDLHKKGYVTLFSEDDAFIATFNMRLHGFRKVPTMHYGRPFWLAIEKALSNRICLEDRITHDYQLDYLRSLFLNYPEQPKFGLVITSTVGHNDIGGLSMLDDDVSEFIDHFVKSGMSNNTVLIIFGDHGTRFGDVRNVPQGKLEERLPHFSITLPEWFPKKYRQKFQSAKRNTKVLTSHFDVFHTLMDLLGLYPVKRNQKEIGMSLFDNIYKQNRHCSQAGVEDHWCPCMSFHPLKTNSDFSRRLSRLVLTHIHKLLHEHSESRAMCSTLEVDRVISVAEGKTSSKVRRFKNTAHNRKCDSCAVVYKDDAPVGPAFVYEIVIQVKPSSGIFETSLALTDREEIRDIHISRTNKYGSQSNCIQGRLPHLRPYCFCKG